MLREEGLNVVTLPKTIDNDLWGTEMTFGFQSAVDIATDTIDRIHTTASSHSRVFIIEVMGHKVGHVTLQSGIAGGADVILLPEIPYDIDKSSRSCRKPLCSWKEILDLSQLLKVLFQKKDAKLKEENSIRQNLQKEDILLLLMRLQLHQKKKQIVRQSHRSRTYTAWWCSLCLRTVYLLQELEHMPLN